MHACVLCTKYILHFISINVGHVFIVRTVLDMYNNFLYCMHTYNTCTFCSTHVYVLYKCMYTGYVLFVILLSVHFCCVRCTNVHAYTCTVQYLRDTIGQFYNVCTYVHTHAYIVPYLRDTICPFLL